MVFIDIHCHLELLDDIESVVKRAKENKVGVIVYNSVNSETMKNSLKLSEKYKEIKACLGIYPVDMLSMSDDEIKDAIDFIRKNKDKIIGIGEVGIDLKEASEIKKQKDNLTIFIRLAKELNIPIFIHSRAAEAIAVELLEEENARKVIMHCFNGNIKLVKRIIKNKWFLSIPTIITYSEHFKKVAEIAPIEQIFCETDSPFLHPIKGTRNNEPSNIVECYKKIAEIKKLNVKEVEENIEDNFKRLFDNQVI